ncbi:unnamed protein product [Porites evermanni]|uniref:F5/8 type C domain-containing protein n=1 Tax=Porites evermanni TaxID=104178 RepID=A0ABN8MR87_9CNID|nr:unnamed protein product [Porites evermanni]
MHEKTAVKGLLFTVFFLGLIRKAATTDQCNGPRQIPIRDKMLKGHIYETRWVRSGYAECLFICRDEKVCQSFNFVVKESKCEFNNRTKEACRPEDFVSDPHRLYVKLDVSRVPLGSIPELPATSCQEINKNEGKKLDSGKYWISLSGTIVHVYCNMSTVPEECQPVGVANSIKIPNAQMTASSYYDARYYPHYGRLNEARGNGGWCPKTRQGPRTDYLQVDLGTIQSVCAVATQGTRVNEWTTSYVLRMSTDEIIWNPYKENNAEKVFQGNADQNTIVKHSLPTAVKARFVRFYYVTYHNWPSIRVEIYV